MSFILWGRVTKDPHTILNIHFFSWCWIVEFRQIEILVPALPWENGYSAKRPARFDADWEIRVGQIYGKFMSRHSQSTHNHGRHGVNHLLPREMCAQPPLYFEFEGDLFAIVGKDGMNIWQAPFQEWYANGLDFFYRGITLAKQWNVDKENSVWGR